MTPIIEIARGQNLLADAVTDAIEFVESNETIMTSYLVLVSNNKRAYTLTFKRPQRLPQEGDVYEWKTTVTTLGGTTYRPGDLMTVIKRTDDAPHQRRSSLGNLLILCKNNHPSVWTEFDHAVATSRLVLVGWVTCEDEERKFKMDKKRFQQWVKNAIENGSDRVYKEVMTKTIAEIEKHDPEASKLLVEVGIAQERLVKHLKQRLG